MGRRPRTVALVALCAGAAAALAVGGALLQGGTGEAVATPASTAGAKAPAPPLELGVLPGEPHAQALIAAERVYAAGRRAEAKRRFDRILASDPGSIPATIGAALSAWPAGAVERLRSLTEREPGSALAHLYLGLALSSTGDAGGAKREWQTAAARQPDTRAAVQAGSLLHPDMAPGLPFFLPDTALPDRLAKLGATDRLAALEERARTGNVADLLLLGAAYQQVGRPVSARQTFDRALAAAPGNLDARVASAVGHFTKDNPSAAFSRLGPLAKAHPKAAIVRFHLGVLLLWIRGVDEAKRQLKLAQEAEPASIYGRQAAALLARLTES